MALVKPEGFGCDCMTDATGRELGMKFGDDFTCLAYDERLGSAAGEGVPWHWHDELELIHVVSGTARLRVAGGSALLHADSAVFVNARAFHQLDGDPQAHIRSIVFDPRLVAGAANSVFAQRYVAPLCQASDMPFLVWRPAPDSSEVHAKDALGDAHLLEQAQDILPHLDRAIDAMEHEETGFEFTVRDGLSQCVLAAWSQIARVHQGIVPAHDGENRLQRMCDFIEEQYAMPLKVEDIAAAAGISQRECLRVFRMALGETPSRFLTIRRLAHAAYLLVNQPEMPVADVARAVGISSASNFAQLFRRDYGCTPRAYRTRARAV